MTDLGSLHQFLGMSVTRSSNGFFLSQVQYALDIPQGASMSECHSKTTPVDTKSKLSTTDGAPIADPSGYKSLARALHYLTMSHPNLAYTIQQMCLFMHNPRQPHIALVKRIMRYVKGTLSS